MTLKENNIWHGLSMNTIYNMDCIEGMKLIPDWSIDAIITDPPYNIARKNNFHAMKNKYWNQHIGEGLIFESGTNDLIFFLGLINELSY